MGGPLSGIRILDLTSYQAGAQGTVVLADLGAQVTKVENTGRGEEGRILYMVGPLENRQSTFFYTCNRGKRSIALDLKRPEAVAIIDKLVANVDVMTNNFRPAVMQRLNLSYERLRRINPRLVYVSASGWGRRGPKANHPALDTAAQARSGLIRQTGETDGFPVPAGAAVADACTAMNFAIAVLAGIVARDRTGEGQRIDLSLFGAALTLQAPEINYSLLSGRQVPRAGRSHPLVPSLTRVFEATDGFVALIGVDDNRWPGFCRATGRLDLEHDERFKDARSRKRNTAALCAELDPVFLTKPRDEWVSRLEAEDQVCSPVQSYQDLASDPVALSNDYVVDIDHPRLGNGKAVATPFEFHGTPLSRGAIDPMLGEHTRQVLTSAGYGEEEIDKLIADGVARQAEV